MLQIKIIPYEEKFFVALLLMLVALSAAAASYTVEVNVAEFVESTVKLSNLSEKNGFLALNYDVFNSGSTGYAARLRMDIYGNSAASKANVPYATIWSKAVSIEPGERKPVSLYWYSNGLKGNFTVDTRIYRANEIEDAGSVTILLENETVPDDIFKIEKVRVYDNSLKIRIKSSDNVEDAVIYAAKYPAGWLFEQEKTGRIEKNRRKWIEIHYEPALFSEKAVTLAVAGNDGAYYSEHEFTMQKEKGLLKYWHMVEDSIT